MKNNHFLGNYFVHQPGVRDCNYNCMWRNNMVYKYSICGAPDIGETYRQGTCNKLKVTGTECNIYFSTFIQLVVYCVPATIVSSSLDIGPDLD